MQNSIISRYAIAMRFKQLWVATAIAAGAMLVGCTEKKEDAKGPAHPTTTLPSDPISKPIPTNGKLHSLAKYIEISGYRLAEPKSGQIRIRMNVVNHSSADLGELPMKFRLVANAAKPEDPPLAEFDIKVSLGPEESKQVESILPTKLRLYELPDWQFLRGQFEIKPAT